MCVRGESRVCKMNGRAFEMLGGMVERLDPFVTYLYYTKTSKKERENT